jgi:predicted ATPase/DNA-binding XRE family transcriptional regulator
MTANPMPTGEVFGDLLRERRVAAGLTQEELAERAGLSVRGISDLERGARARPHRDTLLRLADALAIQGAARSAFVGAARQAPRGLSGTARTIAAMGPATQARLPSPPGSLFGRDVELVRLDELLREEDSRLVTLTGPGGTGKTRLALAAAATAAEAFAAGVVFVDLSPLTASDANLVVSKVAASLDVHEILGEFLSETVARRLASKQLLMLLDNCEQVIDAAADLASQLSDCPSVTILATSREPLRLRAEQVFPVAPLVLPDADPRSVAELATAPAVALFVERARASDPAFQVTEENAASIAAICARLDGLPLAIELAAARITVLSPAAILVRLQRGLSLLTAGARDAPARQRTMRDTIAWSYDLLDRDEQRLFRRLAVFTGGWTLDLAEVVSGFDGDLDVLTGMASLVAKNLVRLTDRRDDHTRYGMLETIREFAAERLADDPAEERVRQAHLDAMLRLALDNDLDDGGPAFEGRLARLSAEDADLRSALEWGLHSNPEGALRLTARLCSYWWVQGRPGEGLDIHERVLATGASPDTPERAIVLCMASWYAITSGDHPRAEFLADAALGLAERLGDERQVARALFCQGTNAMDRHMTRATDLFEDALARFETIGDIWGACNCLNHLGLNAENRGDAAAAASFFERFLADVVEHRGTNTLRSVALGNLAVAYRYLGNHEAALELSTEARRLAEAANSSYNLAAACCTLSVLALDRGEIGRAASLAREGLVIQREIGAPWELAGALEDAAAVMSAGHHAESAARVCGAAFALRTAIESPISGCYQTEFEQNLASLRAILGEPAFARAWAEGERLSPDEAVALALPVLAVIAADES